MRMKDELRGSILIEKVNKLGGDRQEAGASVSLQ